MDCRDPCFLQERIHRLSATLCCPETVSKARYFSYNLLAVTLNRRPARRRVPPLNHSSSPSTLTNHKGRCISHAISMHRLGDLRQTTISNLSTAILCLVAARFEHSTFVVRARQHRHSAIVADFYKIE
jgi:hypothetical protein